MSPRDERELRGSTAIVGVAESDLGEVGPDRTALELAAQAAGRALDEAGLATNDVDGLFTHSAFFGMPSVVTAEYLGIRPRYADTSAIGGASFVSHLRHATAAINAGMCEVALITYGSTQRSAAGGLVTSATNSLPSYEAPFRPRIPVTSYALAAARHMHQFGTTREQLAEIPVAARKWAQLNPLAWEHEDLSIADVLGARMVSTPLTVRDCCLVTDGGGAVVVTSAERARDLPQPPVYLLGGAETSWHMDISGMPDLTVTAASVTGPRALDLAGYRPADVDVVQLYDAFSINTLLFLEDLGFCAKGDGGAFVSDGAIAPGGRLPVNTNGGGLSYCHPGMYGIFLTIEATRQLRGDAGARQLADPHLALVHGNGGVLSSQATAILGDASTL
ncbi:Acetyl-CoA acetyltransferase [Nakamurella panacisegetis]|uniref:Acetyl-CoA acetyltransferase n=1 Tax=Nakamurella panacisegetis TaxID=1090615 RepID=A0A1H0LB96_9ACTN|nr:acetyl-CoA acetyltransferase [Nakamurella panacisegetis]SDO65458.1 Acetyl-CoA acetyltransferase [Nakamurella panacisegetis]